MFRKWPNPIFSFISLDWSNWILTEVPTKSNLNPSAIFLVVATALATEKHPATVSNPAAFGKVNSSLELSCELENQPLSLCVWERSVKGRGEIIIVDQEVIKNGGATSVDGTFATVDGFGNGKCLLKIESLKTDDFGSWSCTLVTNSGRAYGGLVRVLDGLSSSFVKTHWIITQPFFRFICLLCVVFLKCVHAQ